MATNYGYSPACTDSGCMTLTVFRSAPGTGATLTSRRERMQMPFGCTTTHTFCRPRLGSLVSVLIGCLKWAELTAQPAATHSPLLSSVTCYRLSTSSLISVLLGLHQTTGTSTSSGVDYKLPSNAAYVSIRFGSCYGDGDGTGYTYFAHPRLVQSHAASEVRRLPDIGRVL